MFRGDRLAELMADQGFNQSSLGRRVRLSQTVIYKLVSGKTQGSKYLHRLAEVLGVTPAYLMGESDEPGPPGEYERHLEKRRREPDYDAPNKVRSAALTYGNPPAEREDTVELEEFDLSYGMGSTYIHDVPVTGKKRTFSRAWIRHFTDSPMEYLFFAGGIGDSQTPIILDADIVLIDTFDRTPRFADKLWAIEIGGLGSIKRLRPTKDGSGMQLLCANPDVPDDIAYDDEMRVVGRVAGIFRKI